MAKRIGTNRFLRAQGKGRAGKLNAPRKPSAVHWIDGDKRKGCAQSTLLQKAVQS